MIARLLTLFAFFFALPAFAADPFTVAGVPVDAMGENAIDAQTQAITDGQARAAEIVLKRVTLPEQGSRISASTIPPETIARMIRALEIANERRSSQRYLGDITVAFAPSQVQQYLASQNMRMVSTQARERVVLPVLNGSELWSSNGWSNVWDSNRFAHALTPVKFGRGGSDGLISPSAALSLSKNDLARVGQRFGVQQVLVASASGGPGSVQVQVTDVALDTGQQRNLGTVSASTFEGAARAVVERLESDWKRASVSLAQSAVQMPVSVLYRSHDDWMSLQQVINGSAQIQDARLDALSKDGALMTLTYGGDFARLQNELSYKGVEVKQDPRLGPVLCRKGRC